MQTLAILDEIQARFGTDMIQPQCTQDAIPTAWVPAQHVKAVLRYLQREIPQPYRLLYDITAIDERCRGTRTGQPASDFTVVYHITSIDRVADIRLKVPLLGNHPAVETVIDVWPGANWYEREIWDMFGITITGHPHLHRLLLPPWWKGHALRKEHPARATELGHIEMVDDIRAEQEHLMQFTPEAWGMQRHREGFDYLFLNMGPHHPGTHGVLRVIVQLDGQEIVDAVCDIGYHHRGAEKMGERQTWHTYIPYTDRVDYLGGVSNNLPYLLSVEALAGITVPERAQVIRIMMTELFRIISHLVYLGTYVQDIGMMSPVFYMFSDRERAFGIVEAVTGARMHPSWFRIGGVAQDLPEGWETLVRDFISYMRKQLRTYQKSVMENRIFRMRTKGIGQITAEEAQAWGATGPMLRACGVPWDLRKLRPYGGYAQLDFDVATAEQGDCYDRAVVHMEEMWQSLRIMEQCMRQMPPGPYRAKHPLAMPPLKEHTMQDIETLITHFLGASWGPVIPAGEACVPTEGTKGNYSYYLVSDGHTHSYRTRIRAPSFAHIQMVPLMSRGFTVSDLIAVLASVDFMLAEVDR